MKKRVDGQGRWRNVVVSFRMSQAELDDLDARVRLSGMSKQDYIIKRLLQRDIVVQGNPRVYKALRNEMAAILKRLEEAEPQGDIGSDMSALIETVAATLYGMKGDYYGR